MQRMCDQTGNQITIRDDHNENLCRRSREPTLPLGTLVVSQGEVGVVGHFWCQAVGEMLSALRFIHINRCHHLDQLDDTNRHVQSTAEPTNLCPVTCAGLYLPGFGVFTHVRLQVLRQRGWVVVHVCDLYGHRDAGDL